MIVAQEDVVLYVLEPLGRAATAALSGHSTELTLFRLSLIGSSLVHSEGTSSKMVVQCVNPSCCRPLTSLSEGRLFQFEITSISVSAVDDELQEFDETPRRETSNFWLCAQCSRTLTMVMEPVHGLKLVPLEVTGKTLQVPPPRDFREC
jgi:hypothetical protein